MGGVKYPIDVPLDCPFGIQNIPFGIFSTQPSNGHGVRHLNLTRHKLLLIYGVVATKKSWGCNRKVGVGARCISKTWTF